SLAAADRLPGLKSLNRERRATTTGTGCIGVLHHEARTLQTLFVIHIGTLKIRVTHSVYQHPNAILFNQGIVFGSYLIKSKAVLKSGTTTSGHINTQFKIWIGLLFNQTFDLGDR